MSLRVGSQKTAIKLTGLSLSSVPRPYCSDETSAPGSTGLKCTSSDKPIYGRDQVSKKRKMRNSARFARRCQTRRTTSLHLRGARTGASLSLITELVLRDVVRRRMNRSWTFSDRRLARRSVGRGRARRFGRIVRLFGHRELGIDFGWVDEEPVRVGDAARRGIASAGELRKSKSRLDKSSEDDTKARPGKRKGHT